MQAGATMDKVEVDELRWLGWDLQTSNLACLMKGCQVFTISQSGSPSTFPHIFDRHWKTVCVCLREGVRVRGKRT